MQTRAWLGAVSACVCHRARAGTGQGTTQGPERAWTDSRSIKRIEHPIDVHTHGPLRRRIPRPRRPLYRIAHMRLDVRRRERHRAQRHSRRIRRRKLPRWCVRTRAGAAGRRGAGDGHVPGYAALERALAGVRNDVVVFVLRTDELSMGGERVTTAHEAACQGRPR